MKGESIEKHDGKWEHFRIRQEPSTREGPRNLQGGPQLSLLAMADS